MQVRILNITYICRTCDVCWWTVSYCRGSSLRAACSCRAHTHTHTAHCTPGTRPPLFTRTGDDVDEERTTARDFNAARVVRLAGLPAVAVPRVLRWRVSWCGGLEAGPRTATPPRRCTPSTVVPRPQGLNSRAPPPARGGAANRKPACSPRAPRANLIPLMQNETVNERCWSPIYYIKLIKVINVNWYIGFE